jgi:hypothetical protein
VVTTEAAGNKAAGYHHRGARLVWAAVRNRRVDPFALFLMVLFGVGLALTFITGDARFAVLKDSLTSFLAGIFFLGSCALPLLRVPLVFLLPIDGAVATSNVLMAVTYTVLISWTIRSARRTAAAA